MSNGRPWVIYTQYGMVAARFADRMPAQAYCDKMNDRNGGGYSLHFEG